MKFLKQLLQFYVDASLHVALSVACLMALTFYKFHIPFDLNLCLVGFCATIFSYNFMKFGTKAKSYFRVSGFYMKLIQFISFVSFAVMSFLVLQLDWKVWLVLALTGVLTVLYSLPFLPNQQSFRSLSGLKVYFVALCWALTTVIIPVVDDNREIDSAVWLEFFQRFFLVLALLIPFDIRDLKDDNISLGTIPQQVGVKNAKYVGYGFTAIFIAFGLLFFEEKPNHIIADVVLTFLLLVFIFFADTKRSKYYAGFWVESLPIVWLLIYLEL
ncbi:hypothetical protein SAMN05216480_101645 [Pustulibacterium marinum]|uniref:UbiA prenyltransferase family protein n=1 Tax=Pustulibacterium marinum TaxID=1224947 RepID=A0A1I7F5C0_9FLAO|nr:hypothetical protein [Pustulibacterium marinum]SFU31344.1 hypothetical protein SAMN05216480_101645 [Pustulibacterium marinum]